MQREMVQPRRRVSYVIPPPMDAVPRLQLPPHGAQALGSVGPLLIPLGHDAQETEPAAPKWARHPRHRLGISSLALDTSTQLAGRGGPEGILYSGGRDGLILSWDLGIPMKKRKISEDDGSKRIENRWERMTGWADDTIDEEAEEDDRMHMDGDILGDVTISGRKRQRSTVHSIPYESQWETDLAAFKPGKRSEFRQCAQANADWVNDILLCNYNQTVVSASSDGTVKAWNPHSPHPSDPSTIGSHSDYVRCLAHSREQNWVASGSFDRTIKLWDLSRSGQHDALMTLNPPDTNAPKSSIYALAADPYGTTVVSGSPERVVRLWDPRTGKRTGKLVGHTDNIRAILISEDSKYLLTGSADASIKLWSLATQRCLHTFTHHTESVWSLHSSHPSLEIFYSGDRSGLVCKVDVEGCQDVADGECVLLCHDADPCTPSSDGINKIIAMDDNLLWTASGHSSIKRWQVPQRRSIRISTSAFLLNSEGRSESPSQMKYKDSGELASGASTRPSTAHSVRASFASSLQTISSETWPVRRDTDPADTMLYDIPLESLIRLISPNDPFASYSARGRDPEVATLYSAASVKSVPHINSFRSPTTSTFGHIAQTTSPMRSSRTEDTMNPVNTARTAYEERELARDAVPLNTEPEEVITGDHGLVRSIILNDRIHALTVDTSGEVAVWDIVRGLCLGRFLREDVAAVSQSGSWAGGSGGGERERSPREALEAVRERIEGEAVVAAWSTADTKTGVLAIHMTERCFEAEAYADEVGYGGDRRFNDESKINIGRWVLRNLFLGFIREEQRLRRGHDEHNSLDGGSSPGHDRPHAHTHSHDLHIDIPHKNSDTPRRFLTTTTSTTVVHSPKMIPALPPATAPIRGSPLLTPMIPLHIHDMSASLPVLASSDATPMPRRIRAATVDSTTDALVGVTPSASTASSDYFSLRTRQPSLLGTASPAPDDFSGWGGPGKTDPQTPSTPGGLMGRLKNFGKMAGKSQRPVSEVTTSMSGSVGPLGDTTVLSEEPSHTEPADIPKTPVQLILAGPLSAPTSMDAPTYSVPPNTTLLISEEASPGWNTVYRGTVASTKQDVHVLEEAMPLWLVECLLLNKLPPMQAHLKLSFVLLPWPSKDPSEQLPELLNTTQSKLTSSRHLRVRKLVIHVQEKLDKISPRSKPGSSYDGHDPKAEQHSRAEDMYEILCNDVLLSLGMSLAAVRQYVWKSSAELTMYYRRKVPLVSSGVEI
ncbi:hypothetical protein Hypma_014361 [Hypsizygus marmoreus]|uniref:Uncharacterized protein n=1 Tax=Hypsizygus marmoreus TaxID=39966 RepID=A0A369JAX9_HYPMA|nr:hypothetical protein Hypma_014361 [Hypsizygus marmoreus]